MRCFLLLPFLLAGCITPATQNQGGGSQVSPESACASDSDCVLIDADCCNCNHGGSRRAVAASRAKAIIDARAERCAATLCAAVISNDPSCRSDARAVCRKGMCTIE